MSKKFETIPIARTNLTEKDINSVLEPLKSGWLVQGPYVKQFENKWSSFTGSPFSLAVSSCTSGMHLAAVALGLKAGDEVIVPAFSWISTANIVEHQGAKPVFCDINKETFNIDEKKIESLITSKTVGIIPVHLFGLASNMNKITSLAEKYKLWVIEDAACGFGAKYNGEHVGFMGNAGVFSFHPRKAITTGEGGMVCTKDSKLASKIQQLRDHGAIKSDLQRHLGSKPYLLSDHIYAGYNQRMTDIQAALGASQMDRADDIIFERRKIANNYDKAFNKIDILQKPYSNEIYHHGYQSYPCMIKLDKDPILINKIRNEWMEKLQDEGISTRPATHAIHMLSFYQKKYSLRPKDFPNAYLANDCSISLPLFHGMTENEQNRVIDVVTNSVKDIS